MVARKGGLKPLAAVYTQVVRHCLDITDADYEIADAFTDGIIGGKGWDNAVAPQRVARSSFCPP